MKRDTSTNNNIVREVSSYISQGINVKLPSEVIEKARHHILDTLAAMVSGSRLKPGELAKRYIKAQAGVGEAQGAGSEIVTSVDLLSGNENEGRRKTFGFCWRRSGNKG